MCQDLLRKLGGSRFSKLLISNNIWSDSGHSSHVRRTSLSLAKHEPGTTRGVSPPRLTSIAGVGGGRAFVAALSVHHEFSLDSRRRRFCSCVCLTVCRAFLLYVYFYRSVLFNLECDTSCYSLPSCERDNSFTSDSRSKIILRQSMIFEILVTDNYKVIDFKASISG